MYFAPILLSATSAEGLIEKSQKVPKSSVRLDGEAALCAQMDFQAYLEFEQVILERGRNPWPKLLFFLGVFWEWLAGLRSFFWVRFMLHQVEVSRCWRGRSFSMKVAIMFFQVGKTLGFIAQCFEREFCISHVLFPFLIIRGKRLRGGWALDSIAADWSVWKRVKMWKRRRLQLFACSGLGSKCMALCTCPASLWTSLLKPLDHSTGKVERLIDLNRTKFFQAL